MSLKMLAITTSTQYTLCGSKISINVCVCVFVWVVGWVGGWVGETCIMKERLSAHVPIDP